MKDNRMMDQSKTLWHMDRVIDHFEKGKRIAPVHIDMGISKFCNIKCVFCYGMFQNPSKDYIKREALLQMIRDSAEIGIKSLAFIGDGEPTCNPACYEALELANSLGIDMAISTNGILLDDEKIEKILKNCRWMRFCLAAGTKEGYISIHGADYFDKVVENIRRTVEIKEEKGYPCEIGLQAVFVPTIMAQEMIEEARLAVELGVDYFVIKQCSLPDEGQTGMAQFNLNDYDRPNIKEALKKAEYLSTDKTKIIVKWNVISQKGVRNYKGCPSIPLISEMSGNGDWYPCGFMFGNKKEFERYKFGNIHEKTLKQIFYSDRYWYVIKKMREEFNVQTQCKGCCRQDQVNRFLDNYLNKPININFI
jgi:MoaA/NifB/PqqE/SkfB family radical SAM enzyme